MESSHLLRETLRSNGFNMLTNLEFGKFRLLISSIIKGLRDTNLSRNLDYTTYLLKNNKILKLNFEIMSSSKYNDQDILINIYPMIPASAPELDIIKNAINVD